MKYSITFNYVDIVYVAEGMEEFVNRTSTRFFKNYNDKEDFLQTLDMAGEPGTYVVAENSVSNTKARCCYVLAGLLYTADTITFGVCHRLISNAFYYLMHKALVNVVSDKLCYKFDQHMRF